MDEQVRALNEPRYSMSDVAMFLGQMCAEYPELHHVECPRVLDSWRNYCERMGLWTDKPAGDTGAKE